MSRADLQSQNWKRPQNGAALCVELFAYLAAATDFLDDRAAMVALLDDDRAATADINTDAMMSMPITVTIAVATDADVNAGAVTAPTDPRAFKFAASNCHAAAAAFTASSPTTFASVTIAALAGLGLRTFARLTGRSLGGCAPGRSLRFDFGILGKSRASAEQKPNRGEAKQGFLH
jgi:hypothetical protein